MKRHEQLLAAFGLLLFAVGAYLSWRARWPARDILVEAGGCRLPARILEPSQAKPAGFALVFHGLSANRRLMQMLGGWFAAAGLRVYLVDLPGHGDNTDPFSFARAEQCGANLLEALVRRGEIVPERTVLIGHSMGGAIATRLADRLPTAATIAISPGPMVRPAGMPTDMVRYALPRRMPVNFLVMHGQWEPSMKAQADQALLRAAGGERLDAEDFRQLRAAHLVEIPRATHTSLIFDWRVANLSVDWAGEALGEPVREIRRPPGAPIAGGALGLLGLFCAFPAAASLLTSALRAGAGEPALEPLRAAAMLLRWGLAALFAVGVLQFWEPLGALRMLTGAYVSSFFLLAGIVILALLWPAGTQHLSRAKSRDAAPLPRTGGGELDATGAENQRSPGWRAMGMACALGLATVLTFGAWLDWQLTDALMNGPRWWRFVFIVLVCLPYFFAEELALGAPATNRRWRRFGFFLALRLALWLALLFALQALGSGQVLVVLLAVYLALVSLVQRWGADAVRRRTGSAAAAALFGAILAAWFLAAVFPLT